jgi:hypothetical protein
MPLHPSTLDKNDGRLHAPADLPAAKETPFIDWLAWWMGPRDLLYGEQKNLIPLSGIELRFLGHPSRIVIAIANEQAVQSQGAG